MCKRRINKWLVRLVQSMYMDVRSRVRVGNGYSEEFVVRVGAHHDFVLSSLLLIIVLDALSWQFCRCCPWELVYTDDIMIRGESMGNCL